MGSAAVTVFNPAPNGGASNAAAFAILAPNLPPVPNAGPDQSVYRNDPVTVVGTWTDSGGALDNDYTWRWDLDGDGTFDESSTAAYGSQIIRTTGFVVPGTATLTFQVADKYGAVGTDTVQIVVTNRAPIAGDQSLTTPEDTPLLVKLGAADPDNDSLTYSLLSTPQHGSLDGTAPNFTYTP